MQPTHPIGRAVHNGPTRPCLPPCDPDRGETAPRKSHAMRFCAMTTVMGRSRDVAPTRPHPSPADPRDHPMRHRHGNRNTETGLTCHARRSAGRRVTRADQLRGMIGTGATVKRRSAKDTHAAAHGMRECHAMENFETIMITPTSDTPNHQGRDRLPRGDRRRSPIR